METENVAQEATGATVDKPAEAAELAVSATTAPEPVVEAHAEPTAPEPVVEARVEAPMPEAPAEPEMPLSRDVTIGFGSAVQRMV